MSRLLDELRLARVRDGHVRPPGPGREAPSRGAARWRYRVVLLALLLVGVLLALFLVRLLTGYYGQDPGVETGTPQAAAVAGSPLDAARLDADRLDAPSLPLHA